MSKKVQTLIVPLTGFPDVELPSSGYSEAFLSSAQSIKKFGDSETCVQLFCDKENFDFAKCRTVWFFCSLHRSPNEKIMELLIAIDAVRRSSSAEIKIFASYFPYLRQDRRINERLLVDGASFSVAEPISSSLMIQLLESTGADELHVFDPHFPQIEGISRKMRVYSVTLDKLQDYQQNLFSVLSPKSDLVVVAPDAGAIKRARTLALALTKNTEDTKIEVATIEKHRASPGVSRVLSISADVAGKTCVVVDDLVDGGGTLCNAAAYLAEMGALRVSAFITHGILSGNAQSNIETSSLQKLILTDSVPKTTWADSCLKIHYLTISAKLGLKVAGII